MVKKYGIYVPLNEIGYETVHLYKKKEIEEQLLPPLVVDNLEGPIKTEISSFIDKKWDEQLVILVENSFVEPYEVWLVNV